MMTVFQDVVGLSIKVDGLGNGSMMDGWMDEWMDGWMDG